MSVAEYIPRNAAKADRGKAHHRPLHETIASLSKAADRGQQALFAEAKVLFRNFLDAGDVRILVRSGGAWRDWDRIDGIDVVDPVIARLSEGSAAQHDVARIDGFTFAPVETGSVALIVDGLDEAGSNSELIRTLCYIFRLALGSCESRHGNPDKLEAINAFQRVANRILKSRNLQEIFLQITHEAKNRLSADICGIMLKEQDWLVMKRCVGNLASETSSLRMRSGQGVGGRVFETREPCSIEDYVRSEIISRDFFDLARAERVRSALAVPLLSQDEVIGVLEVWRRKPSRFTPQHTAELATLANLALLAIENVGLSEARAAGAQRLEEAHAELKKRYDVIHRSAELQESLLSTLLSGGGLTDIAEKANRHLGAPVAFLDRRLEIKACHPPDACPDELRHALRMAIPRGSGSETRIGAHSVGSLRFLFQRVMAASEHLGWVVVLAANLQHEGAQLAISEICVTTALHLMKERAAARALTDKLASLMWDLVEAPDHVRHLARERANELGVEFTGEFCAILCHVEGLDRPDDSGRLSVGEIESRRRSIADVPQRVPGAHRMIKLSGLRGDELGMIASHRESAQMREIADAMIAEIARQVPGTIARIGISRPTSDPMMLPLAWKDARVALDVARQTGKNRVVAFGDAGVAGLLMSMREGADFKAFVAEKLGELLNEKSLQRDMLMKTLHAYFASNCSQKTAAIELRIHQKTMAYRLEKIQRLTGLDLAYHEHRVLVYLAMRMNDLIA